MIDASVFVLLIAIVIIWIKVTKLGLQRLYLADLRLVGLVDDLDEAVGSLSASCNLCFKLEVYVTLLAV